MIEEYINGGRMEEKYKPVESIDVVEMNIDSSNNIIEINTVFSISLDEFYRNDKCLITIPLLTDSKPFIYSDKIYNRIDFRIFQQLNKNMPGTNVCNELLDWVERKFEYLLQHSEYEIHYVIQFIEK